MNRRASPPALDWLILSLALAGFALNLLLLYQRLADGAAIAGCGGGDCTELLASRWSQVFGVPVTAGGLLAYAALMLAGTPRFERAQVPIAGILLGAAVWFIFVQAVILRRFCPWCIAAHGVAVLVFIACIAVWRDRRLVQSAIAWAVVALLGIGLSQVYGPVPDGHQLDETSSAAAAAVHERGDGRKISFDSGRKRFDVTVLPRLGPADATHVLVEYFDYPCAACGKMSDYTAALLAKHPADVALIVLPVPLESSCNPRVPRGSGHPGSCELARLALAVWRSDPGAFAAFHQSLFAGVDPASARLHAGEIIGPERLTEALRDPWIEELIQANIRDWRALSATTNKLPKLLIRDRRILHGLPGDEAGFIRVIEQELGSL